MSGELEEVGCLFGHEGPPIQLFERQDWWFELPGSFAWQRCPTCGLLFLSPRPTRAGIEAYYPADYVAYRPAIDDERWPWMRWKRRRNLQPHVAAVAERVGGTGRLLDVGCATGTYLAEMRRRGWQVQGVELSPQASAYARERLKLDVATGDLREIDLPAGAFDVVTLWDVLEHTHDPIGVLQAARRVLRPGGLLLFSIPDPGSHSARRFGPSWIGYDTPRHLYLFPGESLALLLQAAGFVLRDSEHRLATYHTWVASFQSALQRRLAPGRARRAVLTLAHLPFWSLLTAPYFDRLNRRGAGTVLTVAAHPSA